MVGQEKKIKIFVMPKVTSVSKSNFIYIDKPNTHTIIFAPYKAVKTHHWLYAEQVPLTLGGITFDA